MSDPEHFWDFGSTLSELNQSSISAISFTNVLVKPLPLKAALSRHLACPSIKLFWHKIAVNERWRPMVFVTGIGQ